MAIINKTGITNGGTIQAEHVTRAIDALSGGSSDTIVATGSFTGSFMGDGASLTGIVATTAATASYVLNSVSSSFSTTASFATSASRAVSSSFATTASFAPQFFTFVTGSNYTNTLENNIDLAITGTLSTYAQAGQKGFQRFVNVSNTLGVWGDIISGDTSLVAGNYEVVYMNTGQKWVAVDQNVYDDVNQPLLGIALDGKSSGTVLLSGYITAYVSGSLSGSGIPIDPGATPRLGYTVWVEEGSASGSIGVAQPSSGAIINVGHIIESGSTTATSQNRLLRINPRYISTI
jgi:hypothetical protein